MHPCRHSTCRLHRHILVLDQFHLDKSIQRGMSCIEHYCNYNDQDNTFHCRIPISLVHSYRKLSNPRLGWEGRICCESSVSPSNQSAWYEVWRCRGSFTWIRASQYGAPSANGTNFLQVIPTFNFQKGGIMEMRKTGHPGIWAWPCWWAPLFYQERDTIE